nr:META domain-containing protein [uncultured Flavobacterium sp.]
MKKKLAFIFIICSLFMINCSASDGIKRSEIDLTSWKLEKLNGKKFVDTTYNVPQINFLIDFRVSGNDGCNDYMGKYILEESKLSFYKMAATKMHCKGVNDNEYNMALNSVTNLKVEDDVLILFANDTEVLEFLKTEFIESKK